MLSTSRVNPHLAHSLTPAAPQRRPVAFARPARSWSEPVDLSALVGSPVAPLAARCLPIACLAFLHAVFLLPTTIHCLCPLRLHESLCRRVKSAAASHAATLSIPGIWERRVPHPPNSGFVENHPPTTHEPWLSPHLLHQRSLQRQPLETFWGRILFLPRVPKLLSLLHTPVLRINSTLPQFRTGASPSRPGRSSEPAL